MKAVGLIHAQFGSRAQLTLLVVLVAIIIGLYFGGMSVGAAVFVRENLGYYFCLCLVGFWGWFAIRCFRHRNGRRFIKQHRIGLLLAVVAGVTLQLLQDHQIRAVDEETAHQWVARSMHEFREVSIPQVGYYLEGQTEFGDRATGTQLFFYSFLVSLVHDLSGYRVINGWLVNGFLGTLYLVVLYVIGASLCPRGGGFFVIFLAAGLPLLDRSATGLGDGFTVVTFLALLFLASWQYAKNPGADELGFLLATGLIAALSGVHSVVGLLYVVIVVGAVWVRRSGDLDWGWFGAMSPIFCLPLLATREIMRSSAGGVLEAGEDPGASLFSTIGENAVGVGAWLFDFSPVYPSFPVLSFVGVMAGITLITTIILSGFRRQPIPAQTWLVLCFGGVILIAPVLLFPGRWWNPLMGHAESFLLPLHLVWLILAAWWMNGIDSRAQVRCLLVGVGVMAFAVGLPARMATPRGNEATVAQHVNWALDWVRENDDGETLYLTPLNTLFLLHDYAAADWCKVEPNFRDWLQLVREGYYDRLVGLVIERYDSQSGTWSPVEPAKALSERIVTRDLDYRRLAYNTRARFFTIEGAINADGRFIRPEDLPYLKEGDYESFPEYFQWMQSIHPGYYWQR